MWLLINHLWLVVNHEWLVVNHEWLVVNHVWLVVSHVWLVVNHVWLVVNYAWLIMYGKTNLYHLSKITHSYWIRNSSPKHIHNKILKNQPRIHLPNKLTLGDRNSGLIRCCDIADTRVNQC